jgi:anti-anti-sigma factor
MKIHQQKHGAVTVIRPIGPVTEGSGELLKQRLLEVKVKSLGRLVLDASAVPFVDSRGLEALLDVSEEMGRSGQALKLCGVNELVRIVLELTDLEGCFEHYDDSNSAVRSFL